MALTELSAGVLDRTIADLITQGQVKLGAYSVVEAAYGVIPLGNMAAIALQRHFHPNLAGAAAAARLVARIASANVHDDSGRALLPDSRNAVRKLLGAHDQLRAIPNYHLLALSLAQLIHELNQSDPTDHFPLVVGS
jgi:hypothetical protein